MQNRRWPSLCAFLIFSCVGDFIGCATQERQKQITRSSDIKTLARLIALPVIPRTVTFSTQAMGNSNAVGPSDWVLHVVATLEPEALESITRRSKRLKHDELPDTNSIQQLPDWVRANWAADILGENVYEASAFEKSPLTHGYFIVLTKNKIYLQLQTS